MHGVASRFYPIATTLLLLIQPSCTKKPESYPTSSGPNYPLSSLNIDDYQTWNCAQLASEADLLKDALAVAMDQHSEEHIAHLNAETDAVKKARTLKKCSV